MVLQCLRQLRTASEDSLQRKPMVWVLIADCRVGANRWYSQGRQCRAAWQCGQHTQARRSWDWSARPPSHHSMAPRSTAKTHLLILLPEVLARAVWHSGRKKVFMSRLNTLRVLSVVWISPPPLQWQAQSPLWNTMSHSCRLQGEGKVKGEQELNETGGKAVTNQPPGHRYVATTGFSAVPHTHIFSLPWLKPWDEQELENSHYVICCCLRAAWRSLCSSNHELQ